MRGRSYSCSPPPPRGYNRRSCSPSPRGSYGGCGRDPPTSLLVRNLSRDVRPEDLHGPFGEFGPLKDIYLPRDYYTGRCSPLCYSRSPRPSRSYSRLPRYARSYSRSHDYYSPSPRRRHYSRSISPRDRKYRERSYSRSPYGSRSRSQSPVRGRSHSRSFEGY